MVGVFTSNIINTKKSDSWKFKWNLDLSFEGFGVLFGFGFFVLLVFLNNIMAVQSNLWSS